MWALVFLKLVLGLGVWLVLRVFASWTSILANYLLVLSLWWDFDYEWVEELGLLEVRLVIEVFSQLELLSTETILGPGTNKTIWADWIVWIGDLEDNWLI